MIAPNVVLGEGLEIDEVFIDYDGPQLFSARTASGRRFVVMHAPADGELDNWLYVEVSEARLQAFGANLISPRVLFGEPESQVLQLLSFDANGSLQKFSSVAPADLPRDYLPSELVAKASLEVSGLRNANENFPVSLVDPQHMWELDKPTIEFLKRNRTPVEVAAERSGRVVADIVFGEGSGRIHLSLPTLGGVLTASQRLLDALAVPDSSLHGPIPLLTRQRTQMDAIAIFPSSFGLRIETHEGSILEQSDSRVAMERLVVLLGAGADPDGLSQILPQIGKRALLQYKAFAKAVGRSGTDIQLKVGLPGAPSSLVAALSADQVVDLQRLLDAETKKTEEVRQIKGRLVAASLRTKFFLIEDDENSYSGRINDNCLPKVDGKPLGGFFTVTIRILKQIDETSGDITEKYELIEIE